MRLGQYLKQAGISASKFAEKVGVVPSTVSRWKAQDRGPEGAEVVAKIIEVTKGKVRLADMLPPERPNDP